MKAVNPISDTLKNAITTKIINTGIAKTAAVAFQAPLLTIAFRITSASAIPTARMISWISDTLSGHI
ncbi:hypothetical protein KBC03_01210 [Patescibacteria group bacterium]|nr:hypothetical protein [Patescibacteria group bacterium]